MSLYGYKKKSKPAPWLAAFPSQAIKTMSRPEKIAKLRKFIKPVSDRKRKTMTEYRERARAFVKAARDRGETCPVVAAVEELREGMMYGHRISAKLNEVHHMRGRAGSLLLDERFWMAISKQGHRWVHEHMDEARKLGWLCEIGKWNTPERP